MKKLNIIIGVIALSTLLQSNYINKRHRSGGLNVVTSILPIHSLASYLMDGVGKPYLIVQAGESPHTYRLRPSDARAIHNANIIFWVGNDLEFVFKNALDSFGNNAEKIELMEIDGLNKLKFRERNIFDDHYDHDDHDDHGDHAHGEYDPHIWLDPMNAKVILNKMAERLIENDTRHEKKYEANLKKALEDIDKLHEEVHTDLSKIKIKNKNKKSIVFHDAYQYFEKRYKLNILGAFTVNTDVLPGAKQISDIQDIIKKKKVNCVFSEPQFKPDIINAVAKDMNIKTGVLDPLGANLNPGKDLYFDLINNMADSFKNC